MKIALLGHGVVGQGVDKILADNAYEDIELSRILVRRKESLADERFTLDYEEILNDAGIDTIIECLGGDEPAHTYVLKALEKKKNVISANKKMLARHLDLFDIADHNGVKLLIEASCGGGIPWFINIGRIRRSDQIKSFKGIMNGTCNYILSSLFNEKIGFAEALKKAQEAGYAEADPSDDIDGDDTLYKTVLSIMKAYDLLSDYKDILCLGIRNIDEEDIAYALKQEKVIKLLGKSSYEDDKLNARVLPCLIDKNSLLAEVSSNNNLLLLNSDHLGEIAFYGQGAGSLPTGQAIVMDLLDLKEGMRDERQILKEAAVADDEEAVFYIRHRDSDVFKEYIDEKLGEHSFISRKIRIDVLKKLLKNQTDDKCFIMEIE